MTSTRTKTTLLLITIITIITVSLSITLAYFIWNSTTNTDVSLTAKGVIVELSDGKDIEASGLMPVSSYLQNTKNVVKKDIKLKLKTTPTTPVTITMSLKINSIDAGLNHNSFKYILTDENQTKVKEGTFETAKTGDSLPLITLNSADGSLTTKMTSYTLYIYIDGESGNNPSSMQNQAFAFTLDITGTNSSLSRMTATKYIENQADDTTGDTGSGIYKVSHSAIAASNSATGTELKATTDYRYYGASPNNYICLDMEDSSTCPDKHLYRIIGSLRDDYDGETKLKIIKATPLTDGTTTKYSFDYTPSGTSKNIWSTTTSGASDGSTLKKLLNTNWLEGLSEEYYNNSTTPVTINFTNTKLSETAQSKINKTSRYYLGGYSALQTIKTEEMYKGERGTTISSGSAKYWDGTVGLIYPSDYGYAAGGKCTANTPPYTYNASCYQKDWLYIANSNVEWTMTPYTSGTTFMWSINGTLATNHSAYITYVVRPTLYLNKDVEIISGTGSQTSPYILSVQ